MKIDDKFHYRKLSGIDNKLSVLIAGSRTFDNYKLLSDICKTLANGNDLRIISGAAKGADTLARKFAEENNYEYIEMPADWGKYGKRAGYIRNQQMHEKLCQYDERLCIAFWDGESKGTQHNFGLAEKFQTPIVIYNYKTNEIQVKNN